jgi:hypothetical protein
MSDQECTLCPTAPDADGIECLACGRVLPRSEPETGDPAYYVAGTASQDRPSASPVNAPRVRRRLFARVKP